MSPSCAAVRNAVQSMTGPRARGTKSMARPIIQAAPIRVWPRPKRCSRRAATSAPNRLLTPPTEMTMPRSTGVMWSSRANRKYKPPMRPPKNAPVAVRWSRARSRGLCHETARPSAISRPMWGVALGSGGGSGLRISQTETAEQRNDRASRRIAMGPVISCTRRPVRPGPEISAMDSEARICCWLPQVQRGPPGTADRPGS